MSFSDLFFSDNPGRREKCIRLSQEIYDAMKNNFVATNDLIEIMRNKIGVSCVTLTFDDRKTIKDNANALISKVHEIQRCLDDKLDEYKRRIEPHIYMKLLNENIELTEKLKYIKQGAKGLELVLTPIVIIRAIYQTARLVTKTVSSVAKVWFGTMVIGVLILGIDIFASVIVGLKERSNLENTIHELQLVVDEFVPASRKYTKEINRLEIKLEDC